jgi:hypothetical protein
VSEEAATGTLDQPLSPNKTGNIETNKDAWISSKQSQTQLSWSIAMAAAQRIAFKNNNKGQQHMVLKETCIQNSHK